jgi:hypothetical protein
MAFVDASVSARWGARPTPVAINVRPVNEPLPAEVTPQVAVHPSLRQLSEPSTVGPSLVAPPPQMAPPRSFVKPNSVTQVFFAEGERKEQGEWTAADLEEFQDVDPELKFDSFDELPRRRTRYVVPLAVLGVVALGAGAAWMGWRPSFLHFNPTMRTSPATATAETAPAAGEPAAPVAEMVPTPVPAAPAEAPAAPAIPTTGAAAAPAAGEVARPRVEERAARAPVEAPVAPVAPAVPVAPVAAPERRPNPFAAVAPSQQIVEVPPPAAGGVAVPAAEAVPQAASSSCAGPARTTSRTSTWRSRSARSSR